MFRKKYDFVKNSCTTKSGEYKYFGSYEIKILQNEEPPSQKIRESCDRRSTKEFLIR